MDLAKAQAAVASVTTRAETAERLLKDTRAELQGERDRNDVSLSQLHEQRAQLIAGQAPADQEGAVEEEVDNTLQVDPAFQAEALTSSCAPVLTPSCANPLTRCLRVR
ncbi:MAG TPA: hypothetical protein VGR26_00230 [Acidimicrobiales bacterium]|nr:hypothetical protein [Acidimicrobiales bacterium]